MKRKKNYDTTYGGNCRLLSLTLRAVVALVCLDSHLILCIGWKNDDDDYKHERIKEKIVILKTFDESDESSDWWVCLKSLWIKCLIAKYYTFQQQQLLNLSFLYTTKHKKEISRLSQKILAYLFWLQIHP